jgi:2',3'-cyclic-nucleotide 2'-phosphodiesterase (5'-nucleotidase family)
VIRIRRLEDEAIARSRASKPRAGAKSAAKPAAKKDSKPAAGDKRKEGPKELPTETRHDFRFAADEAGSESFQVLSLSDWHGNVDSMAGVDPKVRASESRCFFPLTARVEKVKVGGAAAIASFWKLDAEKFTGPTLRLTAGDSFGASPAVSSLNDEAPAVMALRMLGIQVIFFLFFFTRELTLISG